LVGMFMPFECQVPAFQLRTLEFFAGVQHQHEGLEAPG
jgi:hypothetical protein